MALLIGLQSLKVISDKVFAIYVLFAIDAYIGDLSLAFMQIITMFPVSLSHLLYRLMISKHLQNLRLKSKAK